MPHLSKTSKKIMRYALSGFLVTGMILVTGFLSFAGMLLLNNSIYLAITSFFLAGVIEGEVFAQNINRSLYKLFTAEYLKEAILARALKQLLSQPGERNGFLSQYATLAHYVAELEAAHDHSKDEELKSAKRSLKWMQRYFKGFVYRETISDHDIDLYLKETIYAADNNTSPYPFDSELNQVFNEDKRKAICKLIQRKVILGKLSWILNIGAGISCFLVGLQVAQGGIAAIAMHFGIALSGAALSASVFGLAVLGAIGYTALIYNTITDMINNDTLRRWSKEVVTFFNRKPKQYHFQIINPKDEDVKINDIDLYLDENHQLMYVLKTSSKKMIRECIGKNELDPDILERLLTNLKNPLTPIDDECKQALLKITSDKNHTRIKESTPSYVFRIAFGSLAVMIVLGLAIFATVATAGTWWYAAKGGAKIIGLARIGNALRSTTVPIMGATSLLFDVVNSFKSLADLAKISLRENWQHAKNDMQKYFVSENKAQRINPLRIVIKVISIPFKWLSFLGHLLSMGIMGDGLATVPPIATALVNTGKEAIGDIHYFLPEKEHNHNHHHHHTHIDIVGKILMVVLSPLYLLAAAWDYGFSQLNKNGNPSHYLPLKPLEAIQKSFTGLKPKNDSMKPIKKPQLSFAWLEQERKARIEHLSIKKSHKLIDTEKNKVKELTDSICHPERRTPSPPSFLKIDEKINSNTFFSDPTISKKARALGEELIEVNTGYQTKMTRTGG